VTDQRTRHELYRAARQLLGTDRADTLMALMPPAGGAEAATGDDIRRLEAGLDARFAGVEACLDARVAHLGARSDAAWAIADARLADVEARLVRLDTGIAQLAGRLDREPLHHTRALAVGLAAGAAVALPSLWLGLLALGL
jgi:hypothetical protein